MEVGGEVKCSKFVCKQRITHLGSDKEYIFIVRIAKYSFNLSVGRDKVT